MSRRAARPRDVEGLYQRLALPGAQVVTEASTASKAVRRNYLRFAGATVVPIVVMAIAQDETVTKVAIGVLVLIVVAWVVYFFKAFSVVMGDADRFATTLGLRLVETPTYFRAPALDGGSLSGGLLGAMVYEGVRHGRRVSIAHGATEALTTVGNVRPPTPGALPPPTPTGAEAFAALTGAPADTWRGVTVQRTADGTVVRRTGNGAGGWMMQDLLLAEIVAAPT